jgi:galactokinase/mevalonate kinase-like predicted kinase
VVRFLGRDGFAADIDISTEVPLRSGLAGSTAVLASLLGGALLLSGRDPQPDHPQYRYLLAEMVRTVELHFLEVQCGYQDQYMTVFGGLNYMDFRGKELYRTLDREPFATIEPLGHLLNGLPFVIISTGQERVSGAVLKPVRERWLEGDPVVRRGYREIAELASLGKRALLAQDWRTFAQLMNQNHSIQQQVGASGELIDEAVDLALRAGAWGAKLAGAGGGGSIILLHPDFLGQSAEALAGHPIASALLAKYPRGSLIAPRPSPGVTCQEL